jgi:hypothetical protein
MGNFFNNGPKFEFVYIIDIHLEKKNVDLKT